MDDADPDLPLDPGLLARVRRDFERFARDGLPADLPGYLLGEYDLDVSASYAGLPLKNPWGKASGQLSMRAGQVADARDAGIGFVVLKTVIAEDASGGRSMAAWAVREAKMVAERIVGRESGREGWTVTWKGRGWWQSLEDYLGLVREGVGLGLAAGMPVVPSVKYHLPGPGEPAWRVGEYQATTRALLDAYAAAGAPGPMPLEKDFSPTLAGSDRAGARATVLRWVAEVPALIRAAAPPGSLRLGLKLFNALDEDDFQLGLLAAAHAPGGADFLVYANRLFDPDREFEGIRGVAYGGPDLGDRNLRLLDALRAGQAEGSIPRRDLGLSATGDITSGRRAVAYALRGCTSFQLHTLFQLPDDAYPMRRGPKLERALHLLHFDPDAGFIVELHRAAARLGLVTRPIRFLDIARRPLAPSP